MFSPKTHFEQVPLETVRKMMEEQTRQENAALDAQGRQKTILEEGSSSDTQELAMSFRAISHMEA
jgi:hypothetical protein